MIMCTSWLLLTVLAWQAAPTLPTVTIVDRNSRSLSATLPDADSLAALIQGRRVPIAFREIARLEPIRDASGNVTWPVPGFLMAKVTFADQSEGTLAVENIKFASTGLSGPVLLSDAVRIFFRGAGGTGNQLSHDVITLRPVGSAVAGRTGEQGGGERLEGEILHHVFTVKIFYPASGDPVILRFTRDQLLRIEFGDLPLETTVETTVSPLLPPQQTQLSVRPRYDRIFLRNGDRLTGELQGPGLDVKLLDDTRRLIPISALETILFSSR
ncbi:MAG: hypothetical protein ACE5G5_07060 [Candidatus Methylomirabilales bacterium]